MPEINLVPKSVVGEQQKAKDVKNLNTAGFFGALISLLLLLLLFFWQINLKNEIGKVQKQLEEASAELADYKKTEGILGSLNQKYSVYQNYSLTAGSFSQVWSKLKSSLSADGGSIQKLEIKEDGSLILSLGTKDFLSAAGFLKDLQKMGYPDFSIKSVVKQAVTNNVVVTLGLVLKQ